MNRTRVCQHIEELGIVPVVRARSAELAAQAVEALLTGGITVFEITLTVPGAVELIRRLVKKLNGQALIGAGTVLTAEEAERCIQAGARFIVSPGFDAELVELACKREVAVMPGALTPTEVIRADRAGASMVKIFPCSAMGGATYLKALRGPLPHIKLLPTGGVNAQTARDYIRAGACALGVGGELVDQQALEDGRASELSERARELLNAVREARSLSARKLEAS
jgi:2-dehydro-3-deoxyphosphogluconate aldolase/(4S)-4-hydroxy-2-oxoglutarate aldolase